MNNDTAKKGLGELKLYGAPWYITIIGCLVVIAAAYTGALETDFASIMVLIIAYGILFFELGERLPIWNSYIGGGVLAAFFGTAIIRQLSLIPKAYLEPINEFIGGDTINFTSIWIIVLITGSVLSLEKKILLKSFVGYFPAILGGLAAAMGLGVLSGLFFGISPTTIILKYVLSVFVWQTEAEMETWQYLVHQSVWTLWHMHSCLLVLVVELC